MGVTRALPLALAVGCTWRDGVAPDGGSPDDDSAGHADAAAAAPDWAVQMTADDLAELYTRVSPGGSVDLGVAEPAADDGRVARIRLRGDPRLGNDDRTGPAHASELATLATNFHHGEYRMRVRLAACKPGEEVVNGLFTYANDGTDHDGDGLVDNAEIDLEILCGTPAVIFLTVWTEYTSATEEFRRWGRVVELTTGAIWEAPSDREYGIVHVGDDPALALPDLLDPDGFVELGFSWRADRVRFFAVAGGADVTLGELTDPARIPSRPGALMFNAWHPGEHWFGDGAPPDYPADDAVLLVDWARYWRQ
ncbi:MAG TPA: glycoside hydrolase family 16 protein [Kofleriaceae bacterium]